VDLLKALAERTIVLDGAMGTELMRRGFASGGCPEERNVTHGEVVAQIYRDYFAAGADMVETNSLGGTRLKLAAHGHGDDVQRFNSAAVRLAVAVRDGEFPDRLVAGDVGPTGKFVKPMGELEPEELREAFAEQVAALAEGGADLISIETMFDLTEARLAVEGARSVSALPVMVSLTYKFTPRGYRTMMGVDPKTAVGTLLVAGADVVGCNCSIEADEMVGLVGELRAATKAPVVAQPNAGQPRLEGGQTIYDETPAHFAELMPELVAQGANAVGGCCGTTPEHIAALVAALRP
jgi:5-methyltetrahydrofolate--homocysteine methyltransferase